MKNLPSRKRWGLPHSPGFPPMSLAAASQPLLLDWAVGDIPRTWSLESSPLIYSRSLDDVIQPMAFSISYVPLTPKFVFPVLTSPWAPSSYNQLPTLSFDLDSWWVSPRWHVQNETLDFSPNPILPLSFLFSSLISYSARKPESSLFLIFSSFPHPIHKELLKIDFKIHPKYNHFQPVPLLPSQSRQPSPCICTTAVVS